jgi:GT2 family glycosyltransferase
VRVLITVVVPTYRRPEALTACLEALAGQTLPADRFEVVVVDNARAPTSEPVVRAFCDRLDVRLVHEPQPGPAAARNAGLRVPRAAHVAFTDDDCEPEPRWLAALTDALREDPDALIGGRTVDGRSDNLCAAASHLLLERFTARLNIDPEAPAFFATNNLAAPVRGLVDLGGFDTRFTRAAGEDRDLCDRWRSRGRRIVHAPSAIVRHLPRLTLYGFVQRQMSYGRGAFVYHEARAQRRHESMRFEGPGFYAGLLGHAYRMASPSRATAVAALVLLSQIAVAAGYVAEGVAGLPGLKGFRSGG